MTTWHAYQCTKGCGHTTIIDKFYKTKVVFCGVCGTKTTMEYQGERLVENAPLTKSQMNPFASPKPKRKPRKKPTEKENE